MQCVQLNFFRDAVVIFSVSVFDLDHWSVYKLAMCLRKRNDCHCYLGIFVYLSCYEMRCLLRQLFEYRCLNIMRYADDKRTLLY